ncbi:MAG: acyl carrier protein [Rhodospirillales bacterium]|nr:acyl carrier protein [Rhodospirillales bacterium]
MMTQDQARLEVLDSLKSVVPEADAESIDPNTPFRDQLDIDSVDYLNFILTLERRLGVRVPEEDYPQMASLNGAMRWLAGRAYRA